MKNYIKDALNAFLITLLAPIWIYASWHQLMWPDAPWGIRQWHEILGVTMFLNPLITIAIYFISKNLED